MQQSSYGISIRGMRAGDEGQTLPAVSSKLAHQIHQN
jgi:hypothetical protein